MRFATAGDMEEANGILINQVPPCKTDSIPFEIHAISRSNVKSYQMSYSHSQETLLLDFKRN